MASKKERMAAAAATWADATADATKKFFSAADGGAEGGSEAPQATTAKKTTRAKAKAVEPVREASKAPQAGAGSVVFSFRANPDDVTRWKSYAKARQGVTLAEIGAAAMEEYMARHKLADAEAAIYDLEIKKADMLRRL